MQTLFNQIATALLLSFMMYITISTFIQRDIADASHRVEIAYSKGAR